MTLLGKISADAVAWCQGRSWKIRVPVWLLLAYFGVVQAINPQAWTPFVGINLPLHEGGHLLFRLLGWEFLHVAGGTLLQLPRRSGRASCSRGSATTSQSRSASAGSAAP
jgi:hypothetical protein